MRNSRLLLLFVGLAGVAASGRALQGQMTADSVRDLVAEEMADRDVFQFGLSLGPRFLLMRRSNMVEAVISPVDRTLRLDTLQRRDLVLSVSAAFAPFRGGGRMPSELGFLANLDLAKVGQQGSFAGVNQSVEGGVGLVWLFSSRVGVGVTYDRSVQRRPRQFLLDLAGQQVIVDGEPIEALDQTDDRFFVNRTIDGISFRLFFSMGG